LYNYGAFQRNTPFPAQPKLIPSSLRKESQPVQFGKYSVSEFSESFYLYHLQYKICKII